MTARTYGARCCGVKSLAIADADVSALVRLRERMNPALKRAILQEGISA